MSLPTPSTPLDQRDPICGAERAQTAAIRRKCGSGRNVLDKPNPSPPVANSCAHNEMVRRGSTVRVSQRASAKQLRRDGQFPMEADSELLPESSDRHPRKHAWRISNGRL